MTEKESAKLILMASEAKFRESELQKHTARGLDIRKKAKEARVAFEAYLARLVNAQ